MDVRDPDHERKLERIYSKRPCERITIIGQHPDERRTLIASNRLNANNNEVVRPRSRSIADTEAATPAMASREERVPLLQRLVSRMEGRTNKNNILTPSTCHTSYQGSRPATPIDSPDHEVSRRLTFNTNNEVQLRCDDDNQGSRRQRLEIDTSGNAIDRVGVPKKRRLTITTFAQAYASDNTTLGQDTIHSIYEELLVRPCPILQQAAIIAPRPQNVHGACCI